MGPLRSVDPVFLIAVAVIIPIAKLIGLAISLRGSDPADRPAIIRALAELFRVTPNGSRSRRRRR